jgi:signal transduction histidine kinase
MGHDIRTPLNAVIGFADLMQRELHGALGHERYREYANHIRECGVDLLRAAEETLLLTVLLGSPDRLDREAVDLAALVDDTIAGLGPVAGGNYANCECAVPSGLVVLTDKRAMRLALRHLLLSSVAMAPPHAAVLFSGTLDHGVARLDVMVLPAAGDVSTMTAMASTTDADVLLARSILRLMGAELVEGGADATFQFSVLMEAESQTDFFAGA